MAWNCTRRGGTTVAVGAGSPDESLSFSMFDPLLPLEVARRLCLRFG